MLSQKKEGIIAALHAMATRPDSTPDLKSIDVPVLIVTGAEDAIILAAEAPVMLEQIPGARHVEIEGAGHMPMIEQPDSFNRALRGFLAKLDK
jgi:pimeloyl-ACP methyl ester carboxylesterase